MWLTLGAGAAVVTMRQLSRLKRAPAGMAKRVTSLSVAARDFADEVRAGMVEREFELRDALELDGQHGITSDRVDCLAKDGKGTY